MSLCLENGSKVVIDPINERHQKSKDRDDAIWVDGQRRMVFISIADVASYIKEDSALDEIAQLKGFTRYDEQPDFMLPRELSAGKLSLLQGQPRLTMTVQVELDDAYEIQHATIYPSWMVSPYDFSYQEAARAKDTPSSPFSEQLVAAAKIAEKLHRNRTGKELKAKLIINERRGEVMRGQHMHQMIEEYMLLANKALARYCLENNLPIVYRNHRHDREVFGSEGVGYYSDTCDGHEGLGFDSYLHATSPLRRYPDLYVWRIIKHFQETGKVRERDAKRAPRVARRVNWSERLGFSA